MNASVLIHYFLPSASIVLSFFFSVRCLFAHDLRLETWRAPIKHRIYVDRLTFKRWVKSLGILFLMIFLFTVSREIGGMLG